jgi:hypothetical protein
LNLFGKPLKVFAAAALVFSFAACSSSGTPAAPPISDPNEIITRSANGLVGVQTLHLEVNVTGSVNGSGLGSAGGMLGSGAIKLDGTTVTGDVDIQKRAVHITASVPALFGITADIIEVDGYQYMKTSIGGPKYSKSKTADTPLLGTAAPGATLDISKTVNSVKSQLEAAGSTAKLVGTEKVDGRDAYHVSVSVPVSYINGQLGALGSTTEGISLDSASIEYWVYTDSLNPARAEVKAASAKAGSIAVTVNLTKYNQPVTITAPAAADIQAE